MDQERHMEKLDKELKVKERMLQQCAQTLSSAKTEQDELKALLG